MAAQHDCKSVREMSGQAESAGHNLAGSGYISARLLDSGGVAWSRSQQQRHRKVRELRRKVMARTPTVTRDRVPEPLRAAFDVETASSGGVGATGPGAVMINSPEMRRRANHLVNY